MIALGTMTFGGQADEAESRRIVDAALDGGIALFDTANVYTDGRSEEILGRCLEGRRAKIATKVGSGPAGREPRLRREQILRACDESLRRLRRERIDLYYLHQPDAQTPVEESLSAFESLLAAGKIGAVGASNYAAWQLMQMLWKVSVVQTLYNLLARDVERELLPMSRTFGLEVIVYNPLAGGLLTGKHRPGAPTSGTRFDGNEMYQRRYWHDAMFRSVGELDGIAKAAGLTLVQLALRWLKAQGVGIVLGATRAEQVRDNLAALEGPLDEATRRACDEVYARLHGPIPKYNR